MTNGFRGLLVGGGEPIYVKLKEVEKLAVRHFKGEFTKNQFLAFSGHSQSINWPAVFGSTNYAHLDKIKDPGRSKTCGSKTLT